MKIVNIGKENATFQEILAIKNNRNKRASTHLFFIEGVQNIKEAINYKWEIEAFIYTKDKPLSNWAKNILNIANKNFVLTSSLMQKLSDKSETSELLALIKVKEQKNVKYSKNPLLILLDRPSKKGNLGSIIRSCDALNVDQIFYSGHSVDIYDHEVITASMGSFFKLPITFIKSNQDFINLIKKLKNEYKQLQIVATSLQTDDRIQDQDFTKPTLLLIGNETNGLTKFYIGNADTLVKIQMREGIDSLNVACATTACLYEIQRQRI